MHKQGGTFGTNGSSYGNYEYCAWRITVPPHKVRHSYRNVSLTLPPLTKYVNADSSPVERVSFFYATVRF